MTVSMKKKISIAIAVLLIFTAIGFTAYDAETEPYHIRVFHHPFSRTEGIGGLVVPKTYGGPNKYGGYVQIQYYNLTAFGNSIEMAIYLVPNLWGTEVVNLTNGSYLGPAVIASEFAVWIQNESLHFPYTSITLNVSSVVMGVNGTVFNATPGFSGRNFDNFLWMTIDYGGGTYSGEIDSYWAEYGSTYSNATREIIPGNYTFYLNVTVDPVVSVGPYYFSSSPFTARLTFIQDYVFNPSGRWWQG